MRWCWRCGYNRNEWLGLKIFIRRRGRCFYCRIDALDRKYGASMLAEEYRLQRKDKQYKRPASTRWELELQLLKYRLSKSIDPSN